jgi:hypothetical protein
MRSAEQLQPRPLRAGGRDEPRGGRTEHELVCLPSLAAHLDAAALLAHGDDRARLEAAAEMGDPHMRADFGHWARRSEHSTMLGGQRLDAKPVQEIALDRV